MCVCERVPCITKVMETNCPRIEIFISAAVWGYLDETFLNKNK